MEQESIESPPDIKPEGWENVPSLADLKKDLEGSKSAHDAQVTKIDHWLDNLHIRNSAKLKKVAGKSQAQPKLIRKQAEWRYPALSEPFLSTDSLFSVDPVTWEDVKAAEQNQLVLNNQFRTKIDLVNFIDSYVRSAVDKGTAVIRVGWETEEEDVIEQEPVVRFQANPSLAPLHQELLQLKLTNPTVYQHEVPKPLQLAHEETRKTGIPVEPIVVGQREVSVTKTTRNCPTAVVCDHNNVVLDPSCAGDVDKAGFVIYSFETSLSELRKQSIQYQNLDKIIVNEASPLSEPDRTTGDASGFQYEDDARKRLVAYEYWGYWDYDGTGLVSPFVCTWIGSTMIRLEESPFPDKKLPFVFVPFLPVEDSAYGEPDGELLKDNQDVAGAVTRGMIDIMGRSANGQMGVRKDALDATNRRKFQKGLDYEYNGNVHPDVAFYMHTYPEIPASAQFMLQHTNQEAESMSGVKAYTNGINSSALGEVATGIKGVLDASAKRETAILRRLAQGIVKVGRKFISMNAEFLDETEVVRITNDEFVPVRRDDLEGNFDLKLSISTAEEDNAKAERLEFMLQTMGNNIDPGATKIILRNISKLRKMPELANEIENFEPQPDPLEQRIKQLEIAKLEAEIEEIRSKTAENYSEAALDDAKARLTDSQADAVDLDFVEQESGTKQERDKELQGEQARGNVALELVKQRGNQQTELDKYLKSSDK